LVWPKTINANVDCLRTQFYTILNTRHIQ